MPETMRPAALLGFLGLAVALLPAVQAQQITSPTYTREQAAQGKRQYNASCAACHGEKLDDGHFGQPLRGSAFTRQWGSHTVDELFAFTRSKMPPASPGSLGNARYAQILAYVMQQNGLPPGTRELPTDFVALQAMVLPSVAAGPGGAVPSDVKLPPPPAPLHASPLLAYTPVTDALLQDPQPGDWLNWRRTPDAQGFSPLQQISIDNVKNLRVAWTWSLPNGPHEAAPLIHDGVMFVYSFGDRLQALDAASGDLLWQYSRRLPDDAPPSWKRGVALYGDRVYMPTSDSHVIALDVKTGHVAWDKDVADYRRGYGMGSTPVIAHGKVIIGTSGRAKGGNLIVGLDANTGAEVWRFHAVAQPGDPGDSWNGLPADKRSGGSVWVSGSYDAALNTVYFGPAPTYDTGPLRVRANSTVRNDALYTNSTVALDPDTGKLKWHYQHLPNDQWDLDWAFERQIVMLPVNGVSTKVVVTGGKEAIFDAVAGRYLFSMDMGLQNVVTAIDPLTGAKTIDSNLVPGDDKIKMVCPHSGAAKGWHPASYNAASTTLFIPMMESCMDLTPVGPGENGFLSTGVRASIRPRPDSDGLYGRLEAVDLVTRKTVWKRRQRAPMSTGVLATAGGVVFAGSLDRVFAAFDARDGKQLWRARLNDVPNSVPVSFTVRGKQYVAITVGGGGPQAVTFAHLVPEIVNPPEAGATLWVFELPDGG
jgi:alcohol dehydrogenase (cytochrome c)